MVKNNSSDEVEVEEQNLNSQMSVLEFLPNVFSFVFNGPWVFNLNTGVY